jgi:hypothetical protein
VCDIARSSGVAFVVVLAEEAVVKQRGCLVSASKEVVPLSLGLTLDPFDAEPSVLLDDFMRWGSGVIFPLKYPKALPHLAGNLIAELNPSGCLINGGWQSRWQ